MMESVLNCWCQRMAYAGGWRRDLRHAGFGRCRLIKYLFFGGRSHAAANQLLIFQPSEPWRSSLSRRETYGNEKSSDHDTQLLRTRPAIVHSWRGGWLGRPAPPRFRRRRNCRRRCPRVESALAYCVDLVPLLSWSCAVMNVHVLKGGMNQDQQGARLRPLLAPERRSAPTLGTNGRAGDVGSVTGLCKSLRT